MNSDNLQDIQTKPEIIRPLHRTKSIKQTKKVLLQKAIDDPVQMIRKLTKESLFRFIVFFWDTYSDDTFIPNWHIKVLSEELEKVARRVGNNEPKKHDLIINVPPGTTKTALVSIFFPVWCWVNWYWMRFITTSHNKDLSLESAEYSRDIITSEKFQKIFPEIGIKQGKEQKSNFRVVKKEYVHKGRAPREIRGGGRVSSSVESKITGFHAHIIIPDDLIDPKGALSAASINTANKYIDHTLSTRKTDKKVSVMVMIMQRLSENDPTGYLLSKKKSNVRHICLPGEIRNYEKELKPQSLKSNYIDGLLDPNRMPWYVLEEMEADLGQYGFAGQVGQRPTPPGGGMFKVDRFVNIQKMPPDVSIKQIVRYWDKAATDENEIKTGQKAAYTVGLKMAKTDYGKWIIMDVVRGRWDTDVREAKIRSVAEADGKNVKVYVEQEGGSGGKDSIRSTIRNLAGFFCEGDNPSGKGSKVQRADTFSVQVNNGNVLLLSGEWNQSLIDEYRLFPFSTYKDQVDAGSGAFNILTKKREARVL